MLNYAFDAGQSPRKVAALTEDQSDETDPAKSFGVDVGQPGMPSSVNGKSKDPLTDGQRAVVSALLKAGAEGLAKDSLERVRSSARRILKTLQKDADWAKVILMPRQTNGRYRIRS